MGGFSFASVILSYFLTAGGLLTGTFLAVKLQTTSEVMTLLCWAVGSFIGGFFAARASRGSTIIEPAIGAALVVATLVLTIAGSEAGKMVWHAGSGLTSVGKLVAELGAALVVGAIAGAFVSEKAFGEATTSGAPWILYAALTAFGATFMASSLAVIVVVKSNAPAVADAMAKALLIGVGAGTLLAGLAAGASARVRVLGPAFLGGAIGVAGMFLLWVAMTEAGTHDKDAMAGVAMFAVGGGITMLIGAAIGWAAFGKKNA